MYLLKQWRESRYITGLAVVGLVLLLLLAVKGNIAFSSNSTSVHSQNQGIIGEFLVPVFYIEAVFIAFWAWLVAGIGVGKNLGDESGSFLFTRPRRRAWFLWNDWGFAMAQIAIIIILSNLMFGWMAHRLVTATQIPATSGIQLTPGSSPVSLVFLMFLIGVGALLFSGLVYGVTYFSTIVLKRAMGVVLGVGILIGYVILAALLHHYYSIHLPSLIPGPFDIENHRLAGLAGHLGISFMARAVVMLVFPIAAQLILYREEI